MDIQGIINMSSDAVSSYEVQRMKRSCLKSTGALTSRHRENRGCAFTLIELLVVIAIISLLISIILPSLRQAKTIAKQVVCLSNKKTLGMASLMYTTEQDGKFPTMINIWFGAAEMVFQQSVDSLTVNYDVSAKMLGCPNIEGLPEQRAWPSDRTLSNGDVPDNWLTWGSVLRFGEHGLYEWKGGGTLQEPVLQTWSTPFLDTAPYTRDVESPFASRVPIITDDAHWYTAGNTRLCHPTGGGNGWIGWNDRFVPDQLDFYEMISGNNEIFADGHGEWVGRKGLMADGRFFIYFCSLPEDMRP